MDFEHARDDLLVALTAAGATVLLALVSGGLSAITVGTTESIAPLGVYAAYRFSRKGGPYGDLDTAQNWAVLTGVVGGIVLAFNTV
jgi:hypothetical protein